MKTLGFISQKETDKYIKDQSDRTNKLIRKQFKIYSHEVFYVAIHPLEIKGRVSIDHEMEVSEAVAKETKAEVKPVVNNNKFKKFMKNYELKQPVADGTNIMHFGKYKGQRIGDIPAQYLIWLWNGAGMSKKTKLGGEDGKLARYILKESNNLMKECPDVIMDKPSN